ncbi:hypothetical protein PF005_g17135 [Phytophthora fragariae]|uniref:Uncharacterized protein n=1 Tax=Phytophthora fragariae TaxID=53985 RepID=A0A6A4CGE5_9STRA|nr:hypothetical protein PF003_g29630 [Phytophthora fragariae]KAE8933151.1 hypothetical protein PF009_g16831 [Phytophthora fragariae]KAE9087562.1 hypothetical protein PF007_g20325 [Phytophthora fragariae]KAE9087581.1 hypothetical protein PF010_g19676 [Phytophthora fragariae]KAE9125585.1 hypothetical protein PF006_g16926 [Phytophthora fragariae]
MSPSYADTVKLVEDNYFHWEFNMRMKLSRKAPIIKPVFDALSDRSTVQWKTDDLWCDRRRREYHILSLHRWSDNCC